MSKAWILGLCLFVSNALAVESCWESEGCQRITGIGFGVVDRRDDRPEQLKHIAAIRAAKVDAMRALAEQVKGVRMRSISQTGQGELTGDRVVAETETLLRGVRFVKVEPIEIGLYQATVELDFYR